MPDITAIIQGSTTHAWLYLPVAILLGAMHALEPGHAKSLMAVYIVAIRGTATQAIVLAASATVGHTIIVWGLAIAALALGQRYIVDEAEPWLTALSGILIILLALRMFWVLRRDHRSDHTITTTTSMITHTTVIRTRHRLSAATLRPARSSGSDLRAD